MSNNQQPKNIDGINNSATEPRVKKPIQKLALTVDESDHTTTLSPELTAPPTSPAQRHLKLAAVFAKHHVIIITIAIWVLVAGGSLFAWVEFHHTNSHHVTAKIAVVVPKPTPSPIPTTASDPLTGQSVSPNAAQQPVVGVMIENFYPDARPQSGLGQAGIVYEALAEGGITRFLALFQEPLPAVMGPVRSLRPYYLDWGLEHNIPVAHAGGSQPALAEVVPLGMKNINALQYDGSYFYRTKNRYAPHNLYTNAALLTKLVSVLGFNQQPTFKPLPRKADAPMKVPSHTDIKIPFSYTAYNAEYKYNAAANDYLRYEGGAPQIDLNSNQQIQVKNVVVQFIPITYGKQNDGDPDTDYHLVGTGPVLVFEDGGLVTGTWSKTSDNAQTQLLNQAGVPIKLNQGNTWISSVQSGTAVTY